MPSSSSTDLPVVMVRDLIHQYPSPTGEVPFNLSIAQFELYPRELVALLGPSGTGKTTLAKVIAGVEPPTHADTIRVLEPRPGGAVPHDLARLWSEEPEALPRLRRVVFGYAPQAPELFPELTLRENLTLPLQLGGHRVDATRVDAVLRACSRPDPSGGFDLLRIADQRANHASGGQKQRVGAMRAFITQPPVLILDEVTANLDESTAQRMLGVVNRLRAYGTAVLWITHDEPLAVQFADRIVRLGSIGPDHMGIVDEHVRLSPPTP